MADIIFTEDLAPFATIERAKAEAMIADAHAMAARIAPCLSTTTDASVLAAARAILRGAVLRWNDAGSGALASQQAGPFGMSVDTRQERRSMFWPSEITQLQSLCGQGISGVYTVSLAGPDAAASPINLA